MADLSGFTEAQIIDMQRRMTEAEKRAAEVLRKWSTAVQERDAAARREARLRGAAQDSRINMVAASCNGDCLCMNDEWLTQHNARIAAALAYEGKEEP